MQTAHEKPPVNWGYEIKNAFRIIGKVLFKVFSYILNILLTLMLVALVTGIIVGSAMAMYIKNYIDPEIDMSVFPVGQDSTTRIYYPDGNGGFIELEDERIEGSESSIWARYDAMPENLISAFVAIEDKRFFEHNGFDIYRSGNAVLEFASSFSFQSGGSTITQQLVKNITGDKEVRVQRKIEEIFRAMNLEKKKTKQEILELYLNIVPLGRGCTGVQTAANYYFSKDVSELNLIESVCIAAITNNPTRFDPTKNPNANAKRRNVILKQMLAQGKINKTEFDSAFGEDIVLNIKEKDVVSTDVGKINSYFKDALIDKIVSDLVELKGYTVEAASLMLYTGGLQIYTTLDPEIQKILEDFYQNPENFPTSGKGLQPESAMVVMDPSTGYVVGLVGGRGEKTINRGLNRATGTTRPPGSAIKPIAVYAPALDDGTITYGSAIDDAPVQFNGKNGRLVAWPKNLPDTFSGLTTIHESIRVSKNTVAVRVLGLYGLEASFKFMKETLSINSLIDEKVLADGRIITDKGAAALALGQLNYGLTVEEITAAYCIFPNNGVFNEPRLYTKIYDSLGNIVIDNDPKTRTVISAETASIMTNMLQNVTADQQGSTARSITLNKKTGIQVAGKTGTTTSDFDRWFVGYTPYYVAGVWFGYDMPQSLAQFSATTPPACVIWDKVMTQIHQKYLDDEANGIPLRTFEFSAGVIEAEYCKDSGMKPTEACKSLDPRGNRIEKGYFTKQTAPSDSCNVHVVVNMCSETGGISIPGYCHCPSTYRRALIRIESRSFPTYVAIADAGYVYRELPAGVTPSGAVGYPFFKNVLTSREYVGSSSGAQYNRLCVTHCSLYNTYTPPAETEPETTEETTPPDNTVTPPDNANQGGEQTQETQPDIIGENTTPPETEPPQQLDDDPSQFSDTEYIPEPWDIIGD